MLFNIFGTITLENYSLQKRALEKKKVNSQVFLGI